MEDILLRILNNNKDFYNEGKVADYIPALGKADIKDCGITVIDIDNKTYAVGDYKKNFTIQSISKIVTLMLAIMDRSSEEVFKIVGYEGTERPFNAINYLGEDATRQTINPMLNSGAIATTSLVNGKGEERFNRVLDLVRKLALNPHINYDKEVYESERETGDRNRAIAYLMKSKGIIEGDVNSILDSYFKQCSISVNSTDLANIGLSIANRFKDLDLGSKVDKNSLSKILIAIMVHSGMYNASGQWSVEVGIPTKSGVAGGLLSVVPDKYGIGFYGPSLNANGNSVLGYRILKELSKELNLNIY